MEVLMKGIVIGAAALVAALTVAVQWWQYRQVPEPYAAHGQRRRPRND